MSLSYLQPPHLYFAGRAWLDVATANNSRVRTQSGESLYDPIKANLSLPQVASDTLRAWLRTPNALDEGYPNATWNYAGSQSVWFDGVTVTGFDDGGHSSKPDSDPVVSSEVRLLGSVKGDRKRWPIMVDVNPLGMFSTYMMAGRLEIDGSDSSLLSTKIDRETPPPSQAHSYFLNPRRNLEVGRDFGAGANFNMVFPLGFKELKQKSKSPFINRLLSQAGGRGLKCRMTMFSLGRGADPAQVKPDKRNPRPILVVGVLGINGDEPSWAPTGRPLIPVESLQSTAGGAAFKLGPASWGLTSDHSRLVLDFGATIPEREYVDVGDGWDEKFPAKAYLKGLDVIAEDPTSRRGHLIGRLTPDDYDTDTYVRQGGLVYLSVPKPLRSLLDDLELRVVHRHSGRPQHF